jgi:hypothetical protein
LNHESIIYQRIGEFSVSFQWLENKLCEIGWFILDPDRLRWPPIGLRNLTNEKLVDKVHSLFETAIAKCNLAKDVETEFRDSFASAVNLLHQVRRDRNRILHSAFIELKAGGEVLALLRSSPRVETNDKTGETSFDKELLTAESFSAQMKMMGEIALILNRSYTQLISRYPSRELPAI